MITFIRSLFIDLCNRIDKMISVLEQLSMEREVASHFKAITIKYLIDLKERLTFDIESGILENDTFLSNSIIKYNSYHNEFLEIELFRYLAISKYDDKAEGHFERVIEKIYSEIECLQKVPFISTISNSDSYYWAYPKYNMIALPQGEEKNLLNLSDIYHEIGHLIFQQSKDFLINDHLLRLNTHCQQTIRNIRDDNLPFTFIDDINEAQEYWHNSWAEEIACDLIGTFLVGPSYAWTNLKIATLSVSNYGIYSNNLFFRTHPPDEVRMRAIFNMLEMTGFGNDLIEISQAWNKFIKENDNRKHDCYDLIFPVEIIESITTNVFEGCNNILLKPYSEQLTTSENSVSKVINEAWTIIRNDPESFLGWEIEKIKELSK